MTVVKTGQLASQADSRFVAGRMSAAAGQVGLGLPTGNNQSCVLPKRPQGGRPAPVRKNAKAAVWGNDFGRRIAGAAHEFGRHFSGAAGGKG